MKPIEILGMLPAWRNASSGELVASPAWTMPCRLGETPCTMRLDAIRPADTLDVAVLLEDEPHVLSLVDTPRFEELHHVWASRADMLEPVLLALVERECGPLLQLIENAARRQLKVVGLSTSGEEAPGERLCARLCAGEEELLSFAITSSPSLMAAFGKLAFIDVTHSTVREAEFSAVTEFASFALPSEDMSSLAPGDAIMLPEFGNVPPRLVVERLFLVDANGVSRHADDGRLHVLDGETHAVTLGYLFDQAQSPSPVTTDKPAQLRLVVSGRAIANGRLEQLAEQTAFVVEALS